MYTKNNIFGRCNNLKIIWLNNEEILLFLVFYLFRINIL